MHRALQDMAARNILVSEDERCKITDFGLSRKLDDDQDEYMSSVSCQKYI